MVHYGLVIKAANDWCDIERSAGASLHKPPPPIYNNWPSIFWRPFFPFLSSPYRTTTVIHLHAHKIVSIHNMRPLSIREPPFPGALRVVFHRHWSSGLQVAIHRNCHVGLFSARYCFRPFCLSVCLSLCPSHSWSSPKRFKISKYGLSIGTEIGEFEWPWTAWWPLFCVSLANSVASGPVTLDWSKTDECYLQQHLNLV